MTTSAPNWLWIAIVFAAAAMQTIRNAAQKNLTKTAGTLAATSVRFIYGLPFALLMLGVISLSSGRGVAPNATFIAWVTFGAVGQLIATALLLAAMQQRSFIIAVAFSKTEVLQVALFSALLLGEAVAGSTATAIALASVGLALISFRQGSAGIASWISPTAVIGIGSGAGFALSAVGYRAAALSLGELPAWHAGAYGLVWAQAIQSVLLGSYLAWRQPEALRTVAREWRVSLLAGFAGATASFGWFTAFALRNAADVRTLALVEVLYGYVVSWRFFKEKTSRREAIGIALLVIGIALISLQI